MARPDPDLRRARIYDEVAADYARVSLPRLFAVPGRMLAERLQVGAGERALDVGAGTGAVAIALHAAGARVVLADASGDMLHEAMNAGMESCVMTMLPALPFADEAFHVAASAFVMTHVDDAGELAHEMKRVLRRGGRIGLSAWYPADDEASLEWSRIVRTFIDPARLQQALQVTLPGDARFAQKGSLAGLLEGAGFVDITSQDHLVACAMSVDDYIVTREVAATGRAVRSLLSRDEYARLLETARESLRARHGAEVRFSRAFHTAVGTRP